MSMVCFFSSSMFRINTFLSAVIFPFVASEALVSDNQGTVHQQWSKKELDHYYVMKLNVGVVF